MGIHWLLALAMTASCEAYTQGLKRADDGGVPLVVLIGADWCHACKVMDKRIQTEIDKDLLAAIAYAYIDLDEHPRLARGLSGEGALPQLIAFWKTDDGWKRSIVRGSRSVKALEKVLYGWIKQADEAGKDLTDE